jgi:hypothetical protein
MTTPIRSLRLLPKSAIELDKLTGNRGEIFYDPNDTTIRIFDSFVKGGHALLKADLSNIAGGSTNVDFGTRTVESAGFIGTISDISNHNLDDLGNVEVTGATDGQLLYYNGVQAKWKPFSLTGSFKGGSISNPLNIVNSTVSTTTGTGALIVSGGAGIGGAVHIGGSITGNSLTISTSGASITGDSTVTGSLTATTGLTVNTGPISIKGNNRLRLYDTDNTNFIGLKSPANLTADVTYQLPGTDGSSGQALITNGLGTLSWATISGGGGGGGGGGVSNPPGGIVGSVQFNSGTAFSGNETFSYDTGTDTLQVLNTTVTTLLSIAGTLDGNTTGSITNFVDIALNVGATIDEFSTDSTLAGASDTAIPTEAAVKTYVDTGLNLKADLDNPTFTGTVSGITKDMVGLTNVEDTAISTWPGSSNITTVGTLTNLTVSGTVIANSNVAIATAPTSNTHATNKRYVDSRAIAMSIALG